MFYLTRSLGLVHREQISLRRVSGGRRSKGDVVVEVSGSSVGGRSNARGCGDRGGRLAGIPEKTWDVESEMNDSYKKIVKNGSLLGRMGCLDCRSDVRTGPSTGSGRVSVWRERVAPGTLLTCRCCSIVLNPDFREDPVPNIRIIPDEMSSYLAETLAGEEALL